MQVITRRSTIRISVDLVHGNALGQIVGFYGG